MINSYQEYQEKLLKLSTMLDDDIELDIVDEIEEYEKRQGLYNKNEDVIFEGDYNE